MSYGYRPICEHCKNGRYNITIEFQIDERLLKYANDKERYMYMEIVPYITDFMYFDTRLRGTIEGVFYTMKILGF